jgi:hypothetical protein
VALFVPVVKPVDVENVVYVLCRVDWVVHSSCFARKIFACSISFVGCVKIAANDDLPLVLFAIFSSFCSSVFMLSVDVVPI